jgi:hypothetical protein
VITSRVRSSIREQGKVGIDGKPITPARTPYGLLGTPSPMPGQDESPFMTWGQLEGTPQRAMTPGQGTPSGSQSEAARTAAQNAPSFHLGEGTTLYISRLYYKLIIQQMIEKCWVCV